MLNYKTEMLLFILILILGIFLRLWRLDSLPNGLDGDVIITATNSLHIFNGSDFKVLQNNKIIGHPVAYLFWSMPVGSFLIGIFINLFKQIEYGTLFSSAFIGIMSIPIFYFLVRRLTDAPTALLASFIFVVSPLQLVYSRSGFSHITIIVPLVTASIYLLHRIVETKSTKLFVFCGIIWGVILFNSYPIAYVVGPITVLYLIWTNRWKWLFSREFLLGIILAITTFLMLSVGFAYLNKSRDLFIVLKESYYQWISVRFNETQLNTTIPKNIFAGFQMLLGKMTPGYQFGVLRIFNYPMIDYLTGFTFLIGFAVSIIRRNKTDKLLILWIVFSFLLTSVINIPQERYLYILLPATYIFAAAVITPFFKAGMRSRLRIVRLYSPIIFIIFLALYAYFIGYRQYFVSYANNNANMVHGLGDSEVADYLTKNVDPKKSLIITSISLPGVELSTNFQFKQSTTWSEFIKNVSKESLPISPNGISISEYPANSIKTVNDGVIDSYWYGRTPATLQMNTKTPIKISSIITFFSTTRPGRASSVYSIEYLDNRTNQWIQLKKENDNKGVQGSSLREINVNTNELRFNFTKTIVSDSLQTVEEIMLLPSSAKKNFIPQNISEVVLVLALNPNFKYYGNYDDYARLMRRQAEILFGNLDSKLRKTILGNNGETIFEIYTIKVEDIRL